MIHIAGEISATRNWDPEEANGGTKATDGARNERDEREDGKDDVACGNKTGSSDENNFRDKKTSGAEKDGTEHVLQGI